MTAPPPTDPPAVLAIDDLPHAAWVMDRNGRTTRANAAWQALTGHATETVREGGWQQAVHPDDRPRVEAMVTAALASGTRLSGDCRLLTADRRPRWHQVQMQPAADRQTWLGTCSDIHPLKLTQALLKGQTATLEMVARGAPLRAILDAVVLFIEDLSADVLGSILLLEGDRLRHGASPHLPQAYADAIDGSPIGPAAGSCGTAAYGRQRVIVTDIANDPLWRDYAALALSHGLRSCWSQPILAADGTVLGTFAFYTRTPSAPSAWDFTLIEGASHVAGLAIARHVADAERARLVDSLQAAVTARDDFLSVASHELKTPLTSLQLLIDRTRRRLDKRPVGPWLNEDLRAIDRQSRRLCQLDDRLLDVSQLVAGRLTLDPGPVDLGGVVQEVLDRLSEQAAQAGCLVQADLPPDVVGHWDGARLDQVATNLLSNALKFGAGQPVRVSVEADTDEARLTVRDGGIGMAEADLSRLFRRFERLVSSRHYGGFGLGLWIVHQLVDAHGGTVTVTSRPGEGAAFTVSLPRRGPAKEPI